ncbi:MFS multidrug transporter-like protein [Lindgomyces ingoldianus]|uniref:MFS multidrug transporter-like protein n=1 Tax=Lindgomyces ingoldianus TaxID=673940 RepID=A0ACB6QG44_9PLEO|nr:MFS multidrug transporter-like protein [Lindgomyces ingoldianus]KAF2465948.1 MFS multidrug transporter-like protein [Lindgomyces ingoldianus]
MYLFLQNLEIPIVVTSLVSITDDIRGFDRAYWIVSAYLLGYVGVLIIFAKLSDIFGRKAVILPVFAIFIISSAACSAAQSITPLIVFRAFQGVGAAGYALCAIIFVELVPKEKYVKYTASLSFVYALSLSLGPIFGGAISGNGSWRWVFLLNIPAGVPALALIAFCLPNGFPYHSQRALRGEENAESKPKHVIQRIDFPGAILLLLGTLSLTTALQETGRTYAWKSAFTISLLTISGVLWILFLIWERKVTMDSGTMQPVFPWRFMKNRPWLGLLLNGISLGAVWFVTVLELPQKFEIVNGSSPLQAGIHLMPFTFASPIGGVIVSIIAKAKVPPVYLLLSGSILQLVAYILLGTLPISTRISRAEYGYQVLAGMGVGANISLGTLMTPFSVEKQDTAVALGALPQFRIIGGAIGVAIATSVMNSRLNSSLGHLFSPAQIKAVLDSPQALRNAPPEVQDFMTTTLAISHRSVMRILCGFSAGQVLASLITWKKPQIRV